MRKCSDLRPKLKAQKRSVTPVIELLKQNGYRCISIIGKRPDIVAVKNNCVEGIEVIRKANGYDKKKWKKQNPYDKIRWFFSYKGKVKELS